MKRVPKVCSQTHANHQRFYYWFVIKLATNAVWHVAVWCYATAVITPTAVHCACSNSLPCLRMCSSSYTQPVPSLSSMSLLVIPWTAYLSLLPPFAFLSFSHSLTRHFGSFQEMCIFYELHLKCKNTLTVHTGRLPFACTEGEELIKTNAMMFSHVFKVCRVWV